MASFRSINYAIRANKNIERKLLLEVLQRLTNVYPLSEYRYIGMGSMWYVDYVLFHKALGISEMVSLEKHGTYIARAEFNAPYSCIRVVEGESTRVLPKLDLAAKRSVVWMDYDSGIEGPWLRDVPILCEALPAGSVLIITVNAHPERVSTPDANGAALHGEEALRALVGDLAPFDLDTSAFTWNGFSRIFAQLLIDHLRSSTRRSGRSERFVPLAHFRYADDAPMVTVAGVIASKEDQTLLSDSTLWSGLDYVLGEEAFRIAVPHLTPREKAALDQMLPRGSELTVDDVETKLGFRLPASELKGYQRFYRYYPQFVEASF